MGLYDRDYAYENPPGIHLRAPQTMVGRIVMINVVVYLLQLLIPSFTSWFYAEPFWFQQPWEIYRLLTYGFLHDHQGIGQDISVAFHLIGNMFLFWLLGRDLEEKYGSRDFLLFYLWAIFFAGLFWSLSEASMGNTAPMLGASGGVVAVCILYAFHYPHRELLLFFVIPVPMWVVALLLVGQDVYGSIYRTSNIAFTAHLAGAVAGLYFYKFGFSPFAWIADRYAGVRLKRKPKLRIHTPEFQDEPDEDPREQEILRKINKHGIDSLTDSERRYLQQASEKYRRKRS